MFAKNDLTGAPARLSGVNEIQKLIRLYRANECLWNTKTPGFHNYALKENAWKRLSCFFHNKFTVDQLKLEILSLRYYFSKEQEKLKQSELKGIKFVPRHSYFEDLQFLEESVNESSIEAPQKINYLVGNIELLSSSEISFQSDTVDFSLPSKSDESFVNLKEERQIALPQPPLQLGARTLGMRAASGNDSWPPHPLNRSASGYERENDEDRSNYNQGPKRKVLLGRYKSPAKHSNGEDWQSTAGSRSQHAEYDYNYNGKSSRDLCRKKSGEDTTNTQPNYQDQDSCPCLPNRNAQDTNQNQYKPNASRREENGQATNRNQMPCGNNNNPNEKNCTNDGCFKKLDIPPCQQRSQYKREPEREEIPRGYENPKREEIPRGYENPKREEIPRGYENPNDQRYRRYPEEQDGVCPARKYERRNSNGEQMPSRSRNDDRYYQQDPEPRPRRDNSPRPDCRPPPRVEYRTAQRDDPGWDSKRIPCNDDTCGSIDELDDDYVVTPTERDRKMRRMINEEFMESLEKRRRRNDEGCRIRPVRRTCQDPEEESIDLMEECPARLRQNAKPARKVPPPSCQNEEYEEWQANRQFNDEANYRDVPCPRPRQNDNREYYSRNDRPQFSRDPYSNPNNDEYRQARQGYDRFEGCRREDEYPDQERRERRKVKSCPYQPRQKPDYDNCRENGCERYVEPEPTYKQSCSRSYLPKKETYYRCSENYPDNPKQVEIRCTPFIPCNAKYQNDIEENDTRKNSCCNPECDNTPEPAPIPQEEYTCKKPQEKYTCKKPQEEYTCKKPQEEYTCKKPQEEYTCKKPTINRRCSTAPTPVDKENTEEDQANDCCEKQEIKVIVPCKNIEKMMDCACPTDEELEAKNQANQAAAEVCEVAVETDIDMSLNDRQNFVQNCECSDDEKKPNDNEKAKCSKPVKRIGKVCMCKPPVFNKTKKQASDPAGTKTDGLKNRASTSSAKSRSSHKRHNKLEDDSANKFQALGGRPLIIMQEEDENPIPRRFSYRDKFQWGRNKSWFNSHERKQEIDGMNLPNRPIKFISRSANYSQRSFVHHASNPFRNLNFNASKRDVIMLFPPVLGFCSSKHSATSTVVM